MKVIYLWVLVCILGKRIQLDGEWTVSIYKCHYQNDKNILNKNYTTTIPTNIHLDLLNQGIIPNPYFSDNSLRIQWVSQCSIRYTKKFTLNQFSENIQLVFEGIDTYSNVQLNGKSILKTNNAFTKYSISIDKYVKVGRQNTLTIQIQPTNDYDDKGQQNNKMPNRYAHSRKPAYQYGWDWAPSINTMGIWKPVYMNLYISKIDYVWIRNQIISQDRAILNLAVALVDIKPKNNYVLVVMVNNIVLSNKYANSMFEYVQIAIDKPKLWWPNGIGQPYVYEFVVQLLVNGVMIDQKQVIYGIRTVQLDLSNKQFTISINGYKVYCKGANYVPPDMLYPRQINPNYKPIYTLSSIIQDAVNSNFNMIRIWGGGQYESDEFYQQCSRKGLMIFHDFMFSDSIYPSNVQFLTNVQQQIIQQIRRIRNYPCLTLWSGNNQIKQGVQSWRWNTTNWINDYHILFEVLIPNIVQYESPNIPYIPSSPIYGVGNDNFEKGGDIHYWGVWSGGGAFELYNTVFGAFNSQFGTQSLPVWQSILQFTKPTERQYNNKLMIHEKHSSNFDTLRNYINKYGKPAINFEMEVYQSGLIQAFGIEIAIKAQRCNKPNSWGSLYWQLNDAWPAISWSSIDYYGRWKPLQYLVKKIYQNIAIFYYNSQIKVINDNLYPVYAKCLIQIITFDGQILYNATRELNLTENDIQVVDHLDHKLILKRTRDTVLYTEVESNGHTMKSTHYFEYYSKLNLTNASVMVKYNFFLNTITLSSLKLIKNLYISNKAEYVKLSDNYFDLIPTHSVQIKLLSNKKLVELKNTMVYRSYRQVYTNEQLLIVQQKQ